MLAPALVSRVTDATKNPLGNPNRTASILYVPQRHAQRPAESVEPRDGGVPHGPPMVAPASFVHRQDRAPPTVIRRHPHVPLVQGVVSQRARSLEGNSLAFGQAEGDHPRSAFPSQEWR